jgi:hypothetical protein
VTVFRSKSVAGTQRAPNNPCGKLTPLTVSPIVPSRSLLQGASPSAQNDAFFEPSTKRVLEAESVSRESQGRKRKSLPVLHHLESSNSSNSAPPLVPLEGHKPLLTPVGASPQANSDTLAPVTGTASVQTSSCEPPEENADDTSTFEELLTKIGIAATQERSWLKSLDISLCSEITNAGLYVVTTKCSQLEELRVCAIIW